MSRPDPSSAAHEGGAPGAAESEFAMTEFDDMQYDDELSDTATALGLALPPVAPSPAMKAQLMARVASTPQLPAVEAAPVVGRAERAARARWFQRPAAVITAAAAAVALFAAGVVAGGALAPSATDEQQLAAIVAAPDVSTTAAEVTGGGSTTLVSSASLGVSAMVFDGLPTLSSDEAYALWYIDAEGTADAAGLFAAGSDDTVVAVLDGTFEPGTVVGVTVEPSGGSPAPTTQPLVVIATEA
ncbi:anti-sigma factor [Microcella daejeonensis]|uniref:anti-sigma factor n=1 Tax=Microcella daejeonensis TaxID=2994971 RepID=UPI002270F87A|nr:anti-sigma factor [Microcella daejeonensis]WAB84142.1 anti-sigma factor [Microcella daejeonensis]